MKKLEHKVLPCIFCTIGLNCYIAGHNIVHATVQKLTYRGNNAEEKNKELVTIKAKSIK